MKLRLATLLLAAAVPALGAATGAVRRGDLDIRVQLGGTVVADGIFRSSVVLSACARDLKASTGVWRSDGENIANFVSKQLSAAIDADAASGYGPGVLQRAYVATPVYCRDDCYLLHFFVKPNECVQAGAPLFEAAHSLKLIGHVRPEDVPFVRDGAEFSFWSTADPKNRRRARIPSILPDEKGPSAGASFVLTLTPRLYLDPGNWKGELVLPSGKVNALQVPTDALIRHGGRTYLPVRVSTGVHTQSETLIIAGIAAGSEILVLDGPRTAAVRRGDIDLRAKVSGTVVADDVFRLKSSFEGRVEDVASSTWVWRRGGETLARLIPKELSAMFAAAGSQERGVLEDRWKSVYRPTPVRCRGECFILHCYVRSDARVNAQSLLFEAAGSLKLVGRARPEDVPRIKDGQALSFWPIADPARKYSGRIVRSLLDVQGERVSPGTSFVLTLSSDRFLPPGTPWEGEVAVPTIKDVLLAPTDALLVHDGETYLPVRVSTGITTQSVTEIFAAIPEVSSILIPDDSQLRGVERHRQEIDLPAIEKRLRVPVPVPVPVAATPAATKPKPSVPNPHEVQKQKPAPEPTPRETERQPSTLDDKDYGGEDPYGEQ